MARKKYDEVTINRVRRAYVAGEGSLSALAQRFGIGERTIKTWSSQGNWEGQREARSTIVIESINERLSLPTSSDFDPSGILRAAIEDLRSAMATTPAKSKEGCASAMARLIEVHSAMNPVTIDQAIDLLLRLPNFDPLVFAQKLRARIQSGTG